MALNSYEQFRQAKWQLWYQDRFDAECLRQIEYEGQDLFEGLKILWSYHLRETVQGDGRLGFSKFNLWWCQGQRSFEIGEGKLGLAKIKGWLFGSTSNETLTDLKVENDSLLQGLAAAHLQLLVKGQTDQAIIEAAEYSKTQEEFKLRLASLTQENL